MRAARAPLLAALAFVGCTTRWDVDALVAREPGLAALGPARLGDATPYLLPVDGTLVLFLCRWPDARVLRVAPPPDATPAERALLETAVGAWREALPELGLRSVAPGDDAEIRIAFGSRVASRAATTAAECAVDLAAGTRGPRLAAHLVSAAIAIRRSAPDGRGREVPLDDAEIVGGAIHELGHALGFQGHVRRGGVMVREVGEVRRVGRRVLAGRSFGSPTLRALYAVPSGVVVGRRALPDASTAAFDALAARAAVEGWSGPWIRVGDREARIQWRAGEAPQVLWIPDVEGALRDARTLTLESGP